MNMAYLLIEPACYNEDSVLFVQAACTISNDHLADRKEHALALGCLGVFVALFVINYFDYMRQYAYYSYIEWDVKTITAADYTVEFEIDETFFEDFKNTELDKWMDESRQEGREYLSVLQSFQYWLQREM